MSLIVIGQKTCFKPAKNQLCGSGKGSLIHINPS